MTIVTTITGLFTIGLGLIMIRRGRRSLGNPDWFGDAGDGVARALGVLAVILGGILLVVGLVVSLSHK
jgi:uncharacterized membrane protein